MAIADDFEIQADKDIRWTGSGTTAYTVLEFHRFLQDLADDASASGDDLVDITSDTPTERQTDNIITLLNGYNITDTEAEHLYDGSITQDSGATIYAGLVVVGTAVSGTQLQIVQDHALLTNYWTTGLNADAANNILLRLCVKVRANGADIDGRRLRVQAREFNDSYAEFSLTCGLGNNTAAIFTSDDINNETAAATVATYDQFSNTEGLNLLDISGDSTDEEYYSQWAIGGGATPASPAINDLYEYTKWTQRRATSTTLHGMNGELFRGITHSLAYDTEAGTGPVTNDVYSWGLAVAYDNEASGPFSVGEAVTIGSAVGRILSLDDDGATGMLIVSMESGSPADNDTITGQTSGATADVNGAPVGQAVGGGSAVLLAVDDDGATGNLYLQLTKGSAPANNAVLYEDGAVVNTVTVNGTPTQRTVSPEFVGQSTGSALIGAYGIGVDPSDTGVNDQFTDLAGNTVNPPNNVTFTVSGLVSGEDRVLVGPEDGASGLDLDQLSLNTTLNGAAETAIVVTAAIPSDTPATGTIRVQLDDGTYRLVSYTSFSGSTFTIASTDFSTANATAGNNVWISYIDKLAASASETFTVVYSSDRTLFIRVRDGDSTPIKTFETTASLTSAGGSATAIRTSDA